MHFLLRFHFFAWDDRAVIASLVLSLLIMDFPRSRTVEHIYLFFMNSPVSTGH